MRGSSGPLERVVFQKLWQRVSLSAAQGLTAKDTARRSRPLCPPTASQQLPSFCSSYSHRMRKEVPPPASERTWVAAGYPSNTDTNPSVHALAVWDRRKVPHCFHAQKTRSSSGAGRSYRDSTAFKWLLRAMHWRADCNFQVGTHCAPTEPELGTIPRTQVTTQSRVSPSVGDDKGHTSSSGTAWTGPGSPCCPERCNKCKHPDASDR
ncbi:hypothetical protein BV20DRAFT_588707 [Pilatotrama ljubarskyi]|nr:hypothetical protein BV20DRAFT_588707 [Pilatotrama ljubarskyi]